MSDSCGLIWEKKTDDGGVHDFDNTYTWTAVDASPWPFDGTAKTAFLDQLNCQGAYTSGCTPWLGHSDWRLPTSVELGGKEEVAVATGIVDRYASGCFDPFEPVACINAIFGPTQAFEYWTSSTNQLNAAEAWSVDFGYANVMLSAKTAAGIGTPYERYVRAVRSGS